jgi:hypothetical protein
MNQLLANVDEQSSSIEACSEITPLIEVDINH